MSVPPFPRTVLGTHFQNPVLLAAGTAGFGRELAGVVMLEKLGGIVSKAVSPAPRAGNPPPRVREFEDGMVNSVGLANPGLERVGKDELPWLERHLGRARLIVNVVGDTVRDYVTVVSGLSSWKVITAFELNVSCPNTERGGEEFAADPRVLGDLVSRCRDASDIPVVPKLAPGLDDVRRMVDVVVEAGASGVTLVNTLPDVRYRPSHPPGKQLGAGSGGVSGPALLEFGIHAVRTVAQNTDVPVIGVGGIRTRRDVECYLEAGAALTAVGTAALVDPRLPERLARAWN